MNILSRRSRLNFPLISGVILSLSLSACASMMGASQSDYTAKQAHFPAEGIQTGEPTKPYKVLGWIRVKSSFPTMEAPSSEIQRRCVNEFNRAANKLLERAQKRKADAVIRFQSVVFVLTGEQEKFPRPECTDDGEAADITVEGLAIQWKPDTVSPKDPSVKAKERKTVPRKRVRKVMDEKLI